MISPQGYQNVSYIFYRSRLELYLREMLDLTKLFDKIIHNEKYMTK